jgi:microcystin degradation protein MlrC
MSRKDTERHGKAKPSRVLVFGESPNDTAAIRELAEALKPSLVGRIQTRRRPLVLIRNATPDKVPSRAAKIIAVVLAEIENSPVCGVFAHEDCDGTEPKDVAVARRRWRGFR